MSKDNAAKFYTTLSGSADLRAKARKAQSPDELVAMGRELGLDFSVAELLEAGTTATAEQELSDEELDSVVGGKSVWTSKTYGEPGCGHAPHTQMSSCYLTIPPGCGRPPEPEDAPDKDGKIL